MKKHCILIAKLIPTYDVNFFQHTIAQTKWITKSIQHTKEKNAHNDMHPKSQTLFVCIFESIMIEYAQGGIEYGESTDKKCENL